MIKSRKIRILIEVLVVLAVLIGIIYFTRDLNSPEQNLSYEPNTDEAQVEKVFLSYLEAGKTCDIDKAMSIITEKSKEIIHYTCSNMANETKCYRDMDYEIRVSGDNAVLYLTPFSHQIENPLFFTKENGEWKFNFYKMWAGLVMVGSTCHSGWGWRNQELAEEFCSYFEEGQCPDELDFIE